MRNTLSNAVQVGKWGGLAALVIVALAVAVVPRVTDYRWLWVHGPSVDITLGLLEPGIPDELEPGGYVLMVWRGIDPNGISKLREGATIVKKIGCLPGQHLKVTLQQADCDGKKIGHVRHQTMDGKPISPVLYDGIIPLGKVFLMGEHYYSYDSRYFGLVPVEWLQGSLRFTV